MMLLWVLLSVVGAYQAYAMSSYGEACYGKDYSFPYTASNLMRNEKVLFTPKSPRGPTREVFTRSGKALDSRFTMGPYSRVILLAPTMDYAGDYKVTYRFINWTIPVFTLSVNDCSEKVEREYGQSYIFDVSKGEQIDYSPSFNSSDVVIVWSRTEAVQSSGWRLNSRGLVDKRLLPKDQGFYTVRDIHGKYLEKFHIIVKVQQKTFTLLTGGLFTISFPVNGVHYSLTYQPENGLPTTLTQNGYVVDSEHIEVFEGRFKLLPSGVEIRDLEVQDAGTFTLKDNDGNLAVLAELVVKQQVFSLANYGINYSAIMGAVVVVVVIFLCCCGKRCFFKKRSSTTVSHNDQHETTTTDQRPRQPYAMVSNQSPYNPHRPLASATNQQASDIPPPPYMFFAGGGGDVGPSSSFVTPDRVGPIPPKYHPTPPPPPYSPLNTLAAGGGGDLGPSSSFATPDRVSPVHSQGSATGGVDAPTITLGFNCLSSDSGPQFEVPKGLNPSAPPLSSATPSCDVYTSDKFNFL